MRVRTIPRFRRLPSVFVALALLASPANDQETKTVTGAATYRERIALPPDAVFEATLEDVSLSDAPANIIGRARLENPGQPPFRFSIPYDPTRIVEQNAYSVRARVTAGGNLMFTTDQSYPVLTNGHGSHLASIVMRRAAASAGGALGRLPASFSGELPCADCPGIRYGLNLFPDKSFFLRATYIGRGDGRTFDDIGRWDLSGDGTTLTLTGKESVELFAVKGSGVLRKLDSQGGEIDSKRNHDLRRTSPFERIEPRLTMRGMFRYQADAATFAECQSGQHWPVSTEGGYKALEGAYLNTRRQPGEELLVTVEGQIAMRPNNDGGRPTPTLVIERYIGIWPGETCGAAVGAAPLQETYWKLTRLGDKPVILAENQREPSLVFRSQQNRVTGYGGCNNLTGGYQLSGSEITFKGIAATRRACVEGMDIEGALFEGLERARTKILGAHLELYDAGGNLVARFEARALE